MTGGDDRSTLTTTDVEDASRDPPDQQRSRLWPSREDGEQGVDDIFLPNQDGDNKVGEDSVSDPSSVRLVCRGEPDENSHVGAECDAEEPPVDREKHVAQVSNGLGILLFDVLLIQVTLPVETILLDFDATE